MTGSLPPCPLLPPQPEPLTAACLRPFGKFDRGPDFYIQALHYAQSHWQQGSPAQALLLVNRALGADVPADHPVLTSWPLPYATVAWILKHHSPEHFIGNPRRHYQHLATRMVEPRKLLRTWRAWACWAIARRILPEMPADEAQLHMENVVEPTVEEIFLALGKAGNPGEADAWKHILEGINSLRG